MEVTTETTTEKLLRILASLPVQLTVEQSFSTLRSLKTLLWANMAGEKTESINTTKCPSGH